MVCIFLSLDQHQQQQHCNMQAYARKLSALVLDVVSGNLEDIQVGEAKSMAAVDRDFVDLTGAREFLTRESAEEALAGMLGPDAKVTRIKFSTKSFGVEAAEIAAKAIRNVRKSLKHADMSDIVAGRPEEEALQALSILSKALGEAELESLDLSHNALGEKGIRACAAAFEYQKNMKSIAFQNVGCSVHACEALDELLKDCQNLRCIHLLNNMSGDCGASAIANIISRCPLLEEFRMASSRVMEEGGLALVDALMGVESLRVLDLHDNPLSCESGVALADLVIKQTNLTVLNLNDTCLEDTGIEKLALGLSQGAVQLERLELELNEITPEGAAELGAALKTLDKLKYLNLKENELDDDGALEIAKSIVGLKTLEEVDVSTNMIKRGGALALAKAAIILPNVKKLHMDDNEISEAGVEALLSLLKQANKSSILGSLEDNMPDEDDLDQGQHAGHELSLIHI